MTKRLMPDIRDEYISLRLLEIADLSLTMQWRNQEDVRKWFMNTNEISAEQHYSWFERYKELDTDFIFIILATRFCSYPVGQISIYNVNWETGYAEYGRLMIGPAWCRGRGYARRATYLLLNYGFTQMNLKEIHLEVKEDNKSAIAVYETTGFIKTDQKNGLIFMSIYNKMEDDNGRPTYIPS